MSATRDRIFNMISKKPMTKRQLANTLRLSSKTISNNLVDIHKSIYEERGMRGKRYVIFDADNSPRKYHVTSGS